MTLHQKLDHYAISDVTQTLGDANLHWKPHYLNATVMYAVTMHDTVMAVIKLAV